MKQRRDRSETRSPEKDAIFSGEKQGRGKGRGRVCSAAGAEEGEMKRALIFAKRVGGLIILKTGKRLGNVCMYMGWHHYYTEYFRNN